MNATRLSISVLTLSTLLGVFAMAQDKKKAESTQRETVARPMTEKERRKREEKLVYHHRRGTHCVQAIADR